MRALRHRLGRDEGFTLIEVMVVIALMGAVAALAYPSMRGAQDNNNDKHAQTAIRATFEKLHGPYVDAGGSFNVTPAGVQQMLSAAARQDVQYAIRPYRDAGIGGYATSQVAASWLSSAPNAQPPATSSGPRDVSVWFDSVQQVTLCAFSASGRVFCLRDDGSHSLLSGDSSGEVSLSNGTNERDARAALATAAAAAHTVGSPATAIPGWSKRVDATGTVSVPVNTAVPQITGTTSAGSVLTVSNGTWTGPAPITYTRQWIRCDSAGANCNDITGQTNATYTTTNLDSGKTLRVAVVATNASGATSAMSQPSGTIAATAPVNTAVPTVSAAMFNDTWTATATRGSWTSSGTPTYSYQWQRCSGTCADITGATSQTYTLASADVGASVRVKVTATNAGGSASAQSAQSPAVAALIQTGSGTIPDASGNGLNLPFARLTLGGQGATTGGTAATWTAASSSWGQLNNPGAALSPGSGGFTVEAWVRFAAGAANGSVINRYECGWNNCAGADGNASALWNLQLVGGKLNFYVRADNDTTSSSTSPVDSRDGKFHHVVGVLDRSAALTRLYVDGVQVASASASGVGAINDATSGVAVGFDCVAGTNCSTSSTTSMGLDETAIYKAALTPAQVTSHYNARTDQSAYAAAVTADTPAAYWKFASENEYQATVLADGPASYWALEDTSTPAANKISGAASMAANGTVYPSYQVGVLPDGRAFAFNRNGWLQAVVGSSTFNAGPFSAEAWVISNDGQGVILDSYDSVGNSGWFFRLNGSRLWANIGPSGGSTAQVTGTLPVSNNSWHYVAMTWTGSTLAVYVDGKFDSSVSGTAGPTANTAYTTIAGVPFDTGQYTSWRLNGAADEAAFYKKALTASDIARHYRAAGR